MARPVVHDWGGVGDNGQVSAGQADNLHRRGGIATSDDATAYADASWTDARRHRGNTSGGCASIGTHSAKSWSTTCVGGVISF